MRILPSVDDLSSVWRLLVLRAGILVALSVASLTRSRRASSAPARAAKYAFCESR